MPRVSLGLRHIWQHESEFPKTPGSYPPHLYKLIHWCYVFCTKKNIPGHSIPCTPVAVSRASEYTVEDCRGKGSRTSLACYGSDCSTAVYTANIFIAAYHGTKRNMVLCHMVAHCHRSYLFCMKIHTCGCIIIIDPSCTNILSSLPISRYTKPCLMSARSALPLSIS